MAVENSPNVIYPSQEGIGWSLSNKEPLEYINFMELQGASVETRNTKCICYHCGRNQNVTIIAVNNGSPILEGTFICMKCKNIADIHLGRSLRYDMLSKSCGCLFVIFIIVAIIVFIACL